MVSGGKRQRIEESAFHGWLSRCRLNKPELTRLQLDELGKLGITLDRRSRNAEGQETPALREIFASLEAFFERQRTLNIKTTDTAATYPGEDEQTFKRIQSVLCYRLRNDDKLSPDRLEWLKDRGYDLNPFLSAFYHNVKLMEQYKDGNGVPDNAMVNSSGNWYTPWPDKSNDEEQRLLHIFVRTIRGEFYHQELVLLTMMTLQECIELVDRGGAFTDQQFERFLQLVKEAQLSKLKSGYSKSHNTIGNLEAKARRLHALKPPFSFIPPPSVAGKKTFLQKLLDWYSWKQASPEQATDFPSKATAGVVLHTFIFQSIRKKCQKHGYTSEKARDRYELDLLKKFGFFDAYPAEHAVLHYEVLRDLPSVRELLAVTPATTARA